MDNKVATVLVIVASFVLVVISTAFEESKLDKEYQTLYEKEVEDREGLEAIRLLHSHIDDDNDGTIEPAETGEFIRGDLKSADSAKRQHLFHKMDSEITVTDLWTTWTLSEVHNWTVEQTVDWLIHSVELPQYQDLFRQHDVKGKKVPQIAVTPSYLSKTIGITNPIHRSKIVLKAMDIVLFGPPKDQSNVAKDVIFTIIIVMAISGLFYAYHKNKKSQDQLKKMMEDMDKLGIAERDLLELQRKLQQKETKIKNMNTTKTQSVVQGETEEIKRMREEIEELRNQLYAAETELEDKCWSAPPVLQTWLQISYEIESLGFSAKKKEAERQLELAKDMCEKLKKKRSSLVGAFVSTHGHSINEIDKMILEARAGLLDVTKDLQERTQRWKQIEMLCGVSIVNNPGLPVLQKQVRTVGHGRAGRGTLNSRMSSVTDDFVDDSDAYSVAPSLSSITSSSKTTALKPRTFVRPPLSRESSKESASSSSASAGSSDEKEMEALMLRTKADNSIIGGNIETPVSVVNTTSNNNNNNNISNNNNDNNRPDSKVVVPGSTASFDSGIGASTPQTPLQTVPPSVFHARQSIPVSASTPTNLSGLDNVSLSASDSGSFNDLEKKDKKRRSFFNFKRSKKDKKEIL